MKETLEEAAEKEAEGRYPVLTHSNPKNSPYVGTKQTFKHGVRFGAKWQKERMYSEQMEDNKDEYRWTYSEIFDACFPTLGRGGDWAAIAKRLIEQKENK
jgi:hypothetical protein